MGAELDHNIMPLLCQLLPCNLVTLPLVIIVPSSASQLIQVIFKGCWAHVAYHGVPLRHDACIFDALEMRGGAVVVGVVDAEAPPTILPQGAIPFCMVGFLITALETIRERGALAFPFALVFGYSA